MDYNCKPEVNKAFLQEAFDGEVLLCNESTAQAFYLNDTANVVLRLCQEDLTVSQIIALLKDHYPEQEKQIEEDVVTILDQLVSNDVIIIPDE